MPGGVLGEPRSGCYLHATSPAPFLVTMTNAPLPPVIVAAGLFVAACVAAPGSAADTSVSLGADGRLVYATDATGNRIPDFSCAGYRGGGEPLPDVDARVIVEPGTEGDDTARIQAAIREVEALPVDERGFRGALLLRRGRYRVGGRLEITADGVVLRGEGRGPGGTVLVAAERALAH